jgi:hypothetical protein
LDLHTFLPGLIYLPKTPTFAPQPNNLSLSICRIFYEQIRQVTRMSRYECDMNQPVRIWRQYRMANYDLMGIVPPVNLQESGDFFHKPSSFSEGAIHAFPRRERETATTRP